MAFIHVVLIWGTNNIDLNTDGFELTPQMEWERSMGSKLVLGARIFYALFIWASKFTVSEFLKRITIRIWRPSYEKTLHGIRIFLVVTFVAVVLATLLECRPFEHYWQITPDPGPRCRQNFVQLITMGTADIITDILLVAFPIPIVMRSGQSLRRKLGLATLFSLSLTLIGITATRVPQVISQRGRQQYRTVWASCEILASTAVSNAVIIGAFLRDKGTKKNKYKANSVTDSIDRSSMRRPTASTLQGIGSDEDLFRTLGCRIPDHLQDEEKKVVRPAGQAPPLFMSSPFAPNASISEGPNASNEGQHVEDSATENHPSGENYDPLYSPRKPPNDENPRPPTPGIKKQVSFYDVGGLLEQTTTPSPSTTLITTSNPSTIAQDFAPLTPEHSHSHSHSHSRRGSRAFLPTDSGARLTPTHSHSSFENYRPFRRASQGTLPSIPQHRNATPSANLGATPEVQHPRAPLENSLADARGLLSASREPETPGRVTGEVGQTRGREGAVPGWEDDDGGVAFEDVGGLLSR
ncbi:hypothetical protein MBLNU230_g3917t1 [Neophaeotheca triangularis]